jgi:dTDP-4-dehydrorhamnose reductase
VRILVTGGTGQLGHDMVRAAREAGLETIALTRAAGKGREAREGLEGREARDGLDFRRADARGMEAVLRARGAGPDDALVHCAAYTRVDDAEADRDTAFDLNARAVGDLATACARLGVRLVLPSTDYVFDGRADRPYREDDPTGPINVYGASKLEGERLARAAAPDRTLVARTASLFGIAGARRAREGVGGNFVETMIRVGTETGRLRVVDDIIMSPTATRDVAKTILALLRGHAPGGVYHVVNAGQASWCEFARAIIEDALVPAEVQAIPARDYPTPAARPAYSVLDPGHAADVAGLRARGWREALGEYLVERGVGGR